MNLFQSIDNCAEHFLDKLEYQLMSLRDRFSEDLKTALKSADKTKLSTLRLIMAVLKDRDIAAREKGNYDGIQGTEILQLLESMVKQRHESIQLYQKGNNPEAAQREQEEIDIIKSYLPEQLDENATQNAIKDAIQNVEASSLRDMGKVMTYLRENFSGQMDFSRVSVRVKEALSAS